MKREIDDQTEIIAWETKNVEIWLQWKKVTKQEFQISIRSIRYFAKEHICASYF